MIAGGMVVPGCGTSTQNGSRSRHNFLLLLDKQPFLPRTLLQADQGKIAGKLPAVKAEPDGPGSQPLFEINQRLVASLVPDQHFSRAILPFGNGSLETAVVEIVVRHLDGEALVGRVHGRPFRDGPGLEDAAEFQAEVPVEMSGMVFMDDEAWHGVIQ